MALVDRLQGALRSTPLTATPLVGEEDEFDPFAGRELDPPPGDEGDDTVHADETP